VSAQSGDPTRALEFMKHAFASIENHDLPSVAWRLHATAALMNLRIRDFEASDRDCRQAESSLNRAAASLERTIPCAAPC